MLSKRKKNILYSVWAVSVGVLLYVLFRENTYITKLFDLIPVVSAIHQRFNVQVPDFFKYYLPDFLWGFALSCGLVSIHTPNRKGVVICAGMAFSFGILWEFLQSTGIVKGTADIHDVIMYFLASLTSIIINSKEMKENEKN